MLTRIYLDGLQLAHGNGLLQALEQLSCGDQAINPETVLALMEDPTAVDEYGLWRVVEEPAFDASMVRAACESGESFVIVLCGMQQVGEVEGF